MKRNLMYILLATTFWLMPFVSHAETQNATLTVENMSCGDLPSGSSKCIAQVRWGK